MMNDNYKILGESPVETAMKQLKLVQESLERGMFILSKPMLHQIKQDLARYRKVIDE